MDPVPAVVWMPGGVRTEVHLGGQETNDAFCLLVDYPPVGWSLPSHLHRGIAETIYVIEGEFEITVAGQSRRLEAGQAIYVPADVVHSGGNVGQVTGRRIVLFSPAGMERFFLEVGTTAAGSEASASDALASALRHGWEFREGNE